MKRRNLRRARRPHTKSGLSLSYNGPIRLPTGDGLDQKPVKVNISIPFYVSSDASGIASNVVTSPFLASSADWTPYSDVYQEFRVLGIEMKYMPYFNGTYTTSLIQGSGAVATVHVPLTTPPSTLEAVVEHNTWKTFRTSSPLTAHWRMFGVEESTFTSVANVSSVNHGGITYLISDLTPSKDYGKAIATFLIEFRGRK